MDKLLIRQSLGLSGDIKISGAKNAALPIMCASILVNGVLNLSNVPVLKDIKTLSLLLNGMGIRVDTIGNDMVLDASHISGHIAPYELVKTMRASVLVLGPLLARLGEAQVSLPGGCAIGARPVDQHIKGLEMMGAKINIEHGYIHATTTGLIGTRIMMDMITVTGTENLLMAATLAKGTTILENCACEPEVSDLANCLVAMGAKIDGIGTNTLVVHGVAALHDASHSVIADRIEAGTYAVLGAIVKGDITLTNLRIDIMDAVVDKLRLSGATITHGEDWLRIVMRNTPKSVDIATQPYPAFPTDMQAQFMVLNALANGVSKCTENIFENRYMHVPELCRMGADIIVDGNLAIIKGVPELYGASVMATDLRASASLVLAGLAASGETIVDRIYHLDRGYEALEGKLANIGADIARIQ